MQPQSDVLKEVLEKINTIGNEVSEIRRDYNKGFDNIIMVQELQMQQIADLTHGVTRYPYKKQISIDPANSIAKRVRGPDGRALVPNKKFDFHRMSFIDDKTDYDFVVTFEEKVSVLDIVFSERKNTLVQIEDVVLTGADLECLTKSFSYDHEQKSISPEIIDAFVKHYGHMKPVINGNAYLETASLVSMLIMKCAFYDGVDINCYDNMRHESAGLRYLRHDMIFLPICTSVKHWYVAVIDAVKHQVHVLESMETTVYDHTELKLVLQGVQKCLSLAIDNGLYFQNSWTDFNVTNWDINIRYLAEKRIGPQVDFS
uniref:Ubiquitin-like protease family profile domain-containing protein n=1 Tax=Oryza punctata TaxID=4537 RepID=A0A0E0LL54_ORYPU